MLPDFIDTCLQELSTESPHVLYERYIVQPQRRNIQTMKNPNFPPGLSEFGPDLIELFNTMLLKALEKKEGRNSSKLPLPTEPRKQVRQTQPLRRKRKPQPKGPLLAPKNVPSQVNASGDYIRVDSEIYEPPGTWIECVRCKKWRFLEEAHDPSQVSLDWHCGLQQKWKQNSVKGDPCHEEEDHKRRLLMDAEPYLFSEFTAGSVVWAKMTGFPWWPAMVDLDENGVYVDYDRISHKATHYQVVFFDPHILTTKRLPALNLQRYISGELLDESLRASRYWPRIKGAIEQAEDALTVPIQERLCEYGYLYSENPSKVICKRQNWKETHKEKNNEFTRARRTTTRSYKRKLNRQSAKTTKQISLCEHFPQTPVIDLTDPVKAYADSQAPVNTITANQKERRNSKEGTNKAKRKSKQGPNFMRRKIKSKDLLDRSRKNPNLVKSTLKSVPLSECVDKEVIQAEGISIFDMSSTCVAGGIQGERGSSSKCNLPLSGTCDVQVVAPGCLNKETAESSEFSTINLSNYFDLASDVPLSTKDESLSFIKNPFIRHTAGQNLWVKNLHRDNPITQGVAGICVNHGIVIDDAPISLGVHPVSSQETVLNLPKDHMESTQSTHELVERMDSSKQCYPKEHISGKFPQEITLNVPEKAIANPGFTTAANTSQNNDSSSLMEFLKVGVGNKLEERKRSIYTISATLTKLQFHLQLRPFV